MKKSFPVQSGNLVLDTDALTWTFVAEGVLTGDTPPPDPGPTPTPGQDQIDFSQVVMSASPDVHGFTLAASLSMVRLSHSDNQGLEFSKRNGPGAWPFVIGSEGGEIQYTLWPVCKINGVWTTCASIRCISRSPGDNYVPTGPTLKPGQLPENWYYFAPWPMGGYQPQPGEQVGWFLTSGDQRRGDIHTITERTNVVLTPFSEGTFTF